MLEILNNSGLNGWCDYCRRRPSTQVAHLREWTMILAAVYDLPSFFLIAHETDSSSGVVGILPLLHFAPPDGPARLISLPYTDGAGIFADGREIGNRLLAAAMSLAEELDAVHLELRQYGPPEFDPEKGVPVWTHQAHIFKVGLQRPLPASTTELWQDLSGKVRNQVRKAWRCGCTWQTGELELLDDFYAVFSENMRDLGSPCHSPELFRRILTEDRLGANCLVVYRQNVPVAAAMVFIHGQTICNPWSASLRRFRPFCPNMLLYWLMLSHGVQRGCSRFDFGRSTPGAPTCRFKLQWGAEMVPLTWHVFSRSPHSWQPANETLVDEDWKGTELSFSQRQGPAIRRWISL